jgi:hypothetical protein
MWLTEAPPLKAIFWGYTLFCLIAGGILTTMVRRFLTRISQ